MPEVYIYGNGVANMHSPWNLFLDCFSCARYDDFNYATKHAEMQEKNSAATESSLRKHT